MRENWGRERPDRVYDLGIVILECDENQQQERSCACEQTRMVNIGQSYGGLPVYFIRWNPDAYKPKDAKKRQEVIAKGYKLCGDLLGLRRGYINYQWLWYRRFTCILMAGRHYMMLIGMW